VFAVASAEWDARPRLREGQALRGNDGVGVGNDTWLSVPLAETNSHGSGEGEAPDQYIEVFDRAIEELNDSSFDDTRSFGQMVARRGAVKRFEAGVL
jgi:hypothetical protein